ncbi:MAG: hypothetical protein BWX99_01158 [Deltaproteobacteria bacterium ADurb.Bin151]|nr:MAG: hypothetical protein BWX99_01158 [Deltaproteobacteria bacterium ADurb.Bin151]
MVTDDWKDFVKLVLNHAGHGYVEYSSFVIPVKKIAKVESIDRKIQDKYPEAGQNKDQRYRSKRAGKANFAYLRWQNVGLVLCTEGEVKERPDADKFVRLDAEPLIFAVGSMIEIKIARARAGRNYTAFLSKKSYREIKAVVRDNIRHRRPAVAEEYWNRLRGLPAFSGILEQTRELTKWIRKECKLAGLKKWSGGRLVLRPL